MSTFPLRSPPPAIFYPFGLAVFPVLSLAVSNHTENIRASDIAIPAAICLWLALVTWLATRWIVSDRHRRGLLTLVTVVWFSSYGLLVSTFAALGLISRLGQDRYALPLSVLLLAAAYWVISKWKGSGETASRFLNRMCLVLFVLLPISYLNASRAPSLAWTPRIPVLEAPSAGAAQRPDIYYIVVDAYTGSQSLAKVYGFDNSKFEAELRARGFYVPSASRSNYATTFLALAAALNWQYLDTLPELLGKGSRDRSLPYLMIENSRTSSFLKALGYRVVFFPTAYGATARNRFADQTIPSGAAGQPQVQGQFRSVWVASTVLGPVLHLACSAARCVSNTFPFQPESPQFILWKFRQLAELARSSHGPRFVFVHLLVPHEPYVFNPDCSTKPLYWPARIDPSEDPSMRAAYVDQVQCVNHLLLTLIDRLLGESAHPPVVLIQADHGNGRFPYGRPPPREDITKEQLVERTSVFAAYRLPGVSAQLYESITPVNVLPAVLRAYFGAPVPPLEDRTYYSSWERPYDFSEVP